MSYLAGLLRMPPVLSKRASGEDSFWKQLSFMFSQILLVFISLPSNSSHSAQLCTTDGCMNLVFFDLLRNVGPGIVPPSDAIEMAQIWTLQWRENASLGLPLPEEVWKCVLFYASAVERQGSGEKRLLRGHVHHQRPWMYQWSKSGPRGKMGVWC